MSLCHAANKKHFTLNGRKKNINFPPCSFICPNLLQYLISKARINFPFLRLCTISLMSADICKRASPSCGSPAAVRTESKMRQYNNWMTILKMQLWKKKEREQPTDGARGSGRQAAWKPEMSSVGVSGIQRTWQARSLAEFNSQKLWKLLLLPPRLSFLPLWCQAIWARCDLDVLPAPSLEFPPAGNQLSIITGYKSR